MNLYYFGSALNLASLYIFCGLGDAIIIKSGRFNLGGEGQVYAGGVVSGILLVLMKDFPFVFAFLIAFFASFLVSSILSFFSALLQRYKNADFLFTSFLISASIIPILDGVISTTARGKSGNLLATEFINESFRLKSILEPSNLNGSFFFSIFLCFLGFYFIYKTDFGRQLCIYGISSKFGKYCGYNTKKIDYVSAIISGGMHGICGFFAVIGTYYTCHSGFYTGIGWNGLCASLIANSNPLFVIFGGIIMGFIKIFADKYAIFHNSGFDLSSLIQSLILFFFSIPFIFSTKFKNRMINYDF